MNLEKNRFISPQTRLSLLILMVLVSIAGGIFAVQFRFNPAVIQSIGSPVSSDATGTSPPAAALESLVDLPPGIRPLTAPETFSPQRMSDKIDGKAELYLSAGCRGLRSQRFTDSPAGDQQRWMEIFIFDMHTHENAFAVYSTQKRDDAEPLGLTPNGYRTQNALYWIHGGFYVELVASEDSDAARNAMMQIARRFIAAHRVASASIKEPDLFPADGLDSSSVRMIAADAFGFSRLDRIYAANYDTQGGELTAFLSNRLSDAAAVELAAAYRDFLLQFGGTDITAQSELDIPGAVVIEILGANEIIFTRGFYLAGVHEAVDLQLAATVARKLYKQLKDGSIAR